MQYNLSINYPNIDNGVSNENGHLYCDIVLYQHLKNIPKLIIT